MSGVMTITVNPSVDVGLSVDHVVVDKKLRCSQPIYEAGGGGINVSRVLKNYGLDSKCLFLSGNKNGKILENVLNEKEISQIPIKIKGMTRETIHIFEENTKKLYRFNMPGPSVRDEELEKVYKAINSIKPKPEYFIISGSLSFNMSNSYYVSLIKTIRNIGGKVILDTSGQSLEQAVKHGGIFLLKPNMNELRQITNREIKNEIDQENIIKEIISDNKCEHIVLSLGAAGVVYGNKYEIKRLRAPSVNIKSKVGAGDSLLAGIIYGILKGFSMDDSVMYGIASGASAVTTEDSQLAEKEITDSLYKILKTQQ